MSADTEFEHDALMGAALKVPPHSIEAESSVLGSILLDRSAFDLVADRLTADQFYRYEHRLIFEQIATMTKAGKEVDVITVFERFQAEGKADEIGGLVYLNALAQYVPSSANIEAYAEIIADRAAKRAMIVELDSASAKAYGVQDAAELIEAAQAALQAITQGSTQGEEWEGSEAGFSGFVQRLDDLAAGRIKSTAVSTGLRDLDDRLNGGLHEGELIVIGARPRMGKSALALTIADSIARARICCGFFSMEMPKSQVYARRLSMAAGIHLQRIKIPQRLREQDWERITREVQDLSQTPLYVNDMGGLTITQVRAKAKMLHRRKGMRVLFIDYLGLMAATDSKIPRAYQIEEITKGLKQLAKELKISVVLLVQINRKVEERIDQNPMLSDLKDSGSIEQDADVILLLHREWAAKTGLMDEWKDYAKLRVAKLRDGEPGDVDLRYVGENTLFLDWPADHQPPSNRARSAQRSGSGL